MGGMCSLLTLSTRLSPHASVCGLYVGQATHTSRSSHPLTRSHHPCPLQFVQPAENQVVRLIIAVKQQNTDKLEDLFWKVSNPKDKAHYGKHLTTTELRDLVQPKKEDLKKVTDFLRAHGILDGEILRQRDLIRVRAAAHLVKKMLNVELNEYKHSVSGMKVIRAPMHYSLPKDIAGSIDFIEGITRFPRFKKKMVAQGSGNPNPLQPTGQWPDSCTSACSGYITIPVIRQAYNVTGTGSNSNNRQGVTEYDNQYFSNDDLNTLLNDCNLPSETVKVNGNNQPSNPGVEAELDVQYIVATGQNVTTEFWEQPADGSFIDWIAQLLDAQNPPQTFSVSYGANENQYGNSYMQRANQEFQKAGVAGISVIFASGDNGVWGDQGISNQFQPDYPANCPYITSVGATQFPGQVVAPETGADWSGGGFSRVFAVPSYQSSQVSGYLQKQQGNLPPSSYWPASNPGRGYPDVSANGGSNQPYCVIDQGSVVPGAGTSIASPVFAGIIALLNDQRLTAGKSSLGFLNQLLYQNPSAFRDVTTGKNNVALQVDPNGQSPYGFNADQGWDPVTGLGNPDYQALQQLVASLD
eukprot:TRINITY_DN64_c0_g1_i2.p1 TRINITY_DN64_c0_g1~~TRINITY_DN64_c0_g1_i2.p1  ORF type:complete len:582 (-),score=186.93 TRINITY_DN64_c0_g1_i2:185-1930(-)